jgi:hypothetical protein
MEPEVTATNESVTITDRNYQVTFYCYFSRAGGLNFNGVRIKGKVDNDNVWKVLDAWENPTITERFNTKLWWLDANPGYKTPLVARTPQKRVYASHAE